MSSQPEESKKTLEWAIDQLSLCMQTKFYGKVTFIFENGKIVRRTAESSEVPPKIDASTKTN